MGISILNALMIQNNDVLVDTYSNEKETGYGFIIYLMKEGYAHTKIVSTLPEHPFRTQEEAKSIGDGLVKEVKDMDLSAKTSKLEQCLDSKEKETISKIISASKKQ